MTVAKFFRDSWGWAKHAVTLFVTLGRDVIDIIRNPEAAEERLRKEVAELEVHEGRAKLDNAKLKRRKRD